MKRQSQKLSLHRETLRTLEAPTLREALGGFLPQTGGNSAEISICVGCTKKIDHCPAQTETMG